MPTLRFHSIKIESVLPIAKEFVNELAKIYNVPADHFNLEFIESKFIEDGKISAGFPIIEIHAFKRPQEVQDTIAEEITSFMKRCGYEDSEVYFLFPDPRNYYGNGVHY